MKIVVGGVRPQRAATLRRLLPDVDLRCVGPRDPIKTWNQVVVPADLCVIVTAHVGHNALRSVQRVFGRNYHVASSEGDAVKYVVNFVRGSKP